jgi:hypothetical protein
MKMFVNAFLIPEIFNSFSVPTNNKRKFHWDMTLYSFLVSEAPFLVSVKMVGHDNL